MPTPPPIPPPAQDLVPNLDELLPLIYGVSTKWGGAQSLIITPNKLFLIPAAKGTLIPPAYFEPSGVDQLEAYAARHKGGQALALTEIEEVRVSPPVSITLAGGQAGVGCRLQILSKGAVQIHCSLRREEAQMVKHALAQLGWLHKWRVQLNETMLAHESGFQRVVDYLRTMSIWSFLLGLSSLALLSWFATVSTDPTRSLEGKLLILVMGILFILLVRQAGKKDQAAASRTGSESGPDGESSAKSQSLAGREPFRSTLLHWLLKAFVLVLGCAFLLIEVPAFQNNFWLSMWGNGLFYLMLASLLQMAHRLRVRSLPKARIAAGQGPFCLYLRSFNRDRSGSFNFPSFRSAFFGLNPNLPLQRHNLSGRLMLYLANPLSNLRLLFLKPRETAEEQLMAGLTKYMPVTAIGKPGDGVGIVGAQRAYVGDDEWQAAVQQGKNAKTLETL